MDSNSNQKLKLSFAPSLLLWYSQHARVLPWRGSHDPYTVWVSEIMLQQTRVETVIPFFTRWMSVFPTVKHLAESSEQQILNLWEGLGYYSRARSLHKAAQAVCEKYNASLPGNVKELSSLPGIGPYTAAAIASIAFGADEAVVDGNVKRVLARVFKITLPVNTSEGEAAIWTLARELLPAGNAGDYNQALMDLGATLCTPKSPRCKQCPISEMCQANHLAMQNELPFMQAKPPVPHITVCAAVIHREDKVLIAHRPPHGLLGGMWEFPGGKQEPGESIETALVREIREELACEILVQEHIGEYHHAYTHFKVTLHAFYSSLVDQEPIPLEASEIAWVTLKQLSNYPMGKLDRAISKTLKEKSTIF